MAKLDLTKLGGGQKPAIPQTKPSEEKPAGLGFLMNRNKPAEPKQEPVQVDATEEQPTDKPTQQTEAIADQPKPAAGGLAFLKSKTAPPAAPSPKPSSERVVAKPGTAQPSDDLQNLLDNDSGGKPAPTPRVSKFADEEPATAPDRPTEGLDDDMKRFVSSLDSVYQIVHEPDLLGGVIKNIMMELARKPEYRQLIAPKDVHIMIRGMRDSMGMARIKKEESKAKRSGGAKKKSIKVDDLDALAALDELGMDFS